MKKSRGILVLILTAIITVFFCFTAAVGIGPTGTGDMKNIKTGLDLAGGVSITYQAKDSDPSSEDMKDTVYKLQKRVEQYSTEAQVYQEGSDRINVEIPGVTDANAILEELGQPGSLCNLIPRFYDVTSGHIYIDGQDIQQVTLKSLREDIGIVQQDVYLFSGSVADNIAYGKPDATREEIIEAARLAGAERFIMALKDGFDTYVGERGVKLSGGQKQRIAIARVFLKNPPILILDEATSALDNESEILVGQSLEKLAHGRTTLTIAHRLTTIKNYDRILVLGSEGIVESGTHEELLAKQGVYYRLWNQLPGEDTL